MGKHAGFKKRIILLFIICSVACATGPVFAASPEAELNRVIQDQRRFIEEEYINVFKKTEKAGFLKEEQKIKFDWGGLLSNVYRLYKNYDNDRSVKDGVSSILSEGIWLWGKLTFQNYNFLYLRMSDQYSQQTNIHDYTGEATGGDNEGPKVDMAYVSLQSSSRRLNVGRQYFLLGKGIAFSEINDGLLFANYSAKWLLKFFLAHSLPHESNVDDSIPGYDKDSNDRYFFGGEAGYLMNETNALYAYYLIQQDYSKAHPSDIYQKYHYNSYYFGLGFRQGKYDFSSWGELIKEFGRSHTDSAAGYPVETKPIDAWAAILGASYEFKMAFNPISSLEFSYGSGDSSRTSVVATKTGGNRSSRDTNFLYFGNYYGGYALSPRLSNLLIFKIDQSIKPLYFTEKFKDIIVGAKFFAYLKDKKDGGICDLDATEAKRFVGTELDFYLYWTILKNLDFILRYGVFYPGNAYPANTNSPNKYLYSRLTYSF